MVGEKVMFESIKNLFKTEGKDVKMSKVLYITANPKSVEQSYSLAVGQEFLKAYKQENPQDEIVEIDLYKTEVPLIDQDVFSGWGKLQQGVAFKELSSVEQSKVAGINQFTDQFITADKYVFVTPLWNFSTPPQLKAYIDTICIAGKTFKYTENGPQGLLTDKAAVHIQSRGGVYSEGPAQAYELGDRYLQTIFGFLGIQSLESVIIEGTAQMPDQAENIKAQAISKAQEVAKKLATINVSK
jgi:FMN-dependent NADH-azoreductase